MRCRTCKEPFEPARADAKFLLEACAPSRVCRGTLAHWAHGPARKPVRLRARASFGWHTGTAHGGVRFGPLGALCGVSKGAAR
jgi:hypothetical protein